MNPGVLFDAVISDRAVPVDPSIPLLVWWAHRLAELGLTPCYGPGDHGNLSCRGERTVLISARETAKATLQPSDVVEILGVEEADDVWTIRCRGLRLPSTDTRLHLHVYAVRPDVRAIIHGHDPQTLAHVKALRLPMTASSAAVPSRELIQNVCDLIQQDDYLLLRDHGFLAVGRTLDEAGERVRLLCSRARALG